MDTNFLKKLNEVDVKDLKNIDLFEIKSLVLNYVDVIIIFLLILLTILGTLGFQNNFQRTANRLKKESVDLEEKLKTIEEYDKKKKDHDTFVSYFPEAVPKEQINKKLSSFAIDNNVQIISFAPKEEIVQDYFKINKFDLTLSSREYKDLVTFLRDIEKSPYAMRVVHWSAGNIQAGNTRGYGISSGSDEESQKIQVKIKLESIELLK